MEVEMKAWVSPMQIDKLLSLEKSTGFKICTLDIEKRFKKDVYYSFNGDVLKEPKRIIRIRTENSAPIEQGKEIVDVCKILSTDFKSPAKTYLTVKERHTDESGIETNEEYESILDNIETKNTLTKVLEIANFKPYFTKSKGSISFYVNRTSDNKKLHCEIVAVNGLGPLLEVEVFAPASQYDIVEDYMCGSVADAKELLKEFFWKVVQINEDGLEKRPWPDIIKDLSS